MTQRMKLAPRMIQSMEILQMPLCALEERIKEELDSNPVLEQAAVEPEQAEQQTAEENQQSVDEKDLVVSGDANKLEDFERLGNLDDSFADHLKMSGSYHRRVSPDEPDAKLEAIKNTAAAPQSLHEYLTGQWRLVEADEPVKIAGQLIIDYIGDRGYLTVRVEQLYNKDKSEFKPEHLQQALELVQNLEPAGIGARDLKDCLLIQMAQKNDDMAFESRIVSQHMDELLDNRLPDIAKKMNCGIEDVKRAIARMSKLDTSPGLQISSVPNHAITADVIIEKAEDSDGFTVRLADSRLPGVKINSMYSEMVSDRKVNKKTREFLKENIRSAQWLLEAIEQRRNTLLKVSTSIVKRQKDFFLKGPLHLKPLPMASVAEDVGVHLATVSRAVSGKYIQCAYGVLPLRKFFSGGLEDDTGKSLSWEAVREKLQQIINAEDKSKPLSDDKIRLKLAEAGVPNLARRTVAKYRKILNIPSARYRKKY